MPVLTDRLVLTEKKHRIAGLFSQEQKYKYSSNYLDDEKVMFMTEDSFISIKTGHVKSGACLLIKSYVLFSHKSLVDVSVVFGSLMKRYGFSGYLMGLLEGDEKYSELVQPCLFTRLDPKIIPSVSLNPKDIFCRSHSALIVLHLEAIRSAKETINYLSTLHAPDGSQLEAGGKSVIALMSRKDGLIKSATSMGLDKIIIMEDICKDLT